MTQEPLVSVIYPRFELVVADDGSTDSTPERLASFRKPSLRHLKLEHTGRPSVSRNRGLTAARGNMVAFLDDDDVWLPDKLGKQVELLNRFPEAGFVYTDIRLLQTDGSVSDPILQPTDKWQGKIFDALLVNGFIYVSTVVLRRGLVQSVGLFDETLEAIEDFDFWLRVTFASSAAFLDEPVVLIRRHPGGISSRRQLLVHENMLLVLERARERLPLSLMQRLSLRRATARAHTRLGLHHLKCGELSVGRRHILRSIGLNPLQRSAWKSLVRSR
jgi:glycosyltransferase involved in cell wall biosynthesis